jgi:cellobiose phosphorylase
MKVSNTLGLLFSFSEGGTLQSIDANTIRISMTSSSVYSRAGANLYLRKRGGACTPLLGAHARLRATEGVLEAKGSWDGLDYECVLQPAPAALAWRWRVHVVSRLAAPVELDLLYVQDVGLKAKSASLVNEYYVSQYLERRVLEHPTHGSVVCCRQNMREAGRNPWLLLASANRAASASTDGLQFYGRTFRATGEPEGLRADALPGELNAESSVVALQEQPFVLAPGASHTSSFVASYLPDHPDASSEADLARLPELVRSFPEPSIAGVELTPSPVQVPSLLQAEELSPEERLALFGAAQHVERDGAQVLSFFVEGPRHVVLAAKETRVDRPHGHIMQANVGYTPDERVMSTTAFACGVFHSHLTQGNTNFNTLLSVCTNPSASALEGQRIVLQLEHGERLLGVPSAFEMGLNHCRWIYKFGERTLQVRSWTSPRSPRAHLDVEVLRGEPVRFFVTHQLDGLNGWTITPGGEDEYVATPRADSVLASKFPGARFRLLTSGEVRASERAEQTFVLDVPATSHFGLSFVGEVTGAVDVPRTRDAEADGQDALSAWRELSRALVLRGPKEIAAIGTILPWYGLNALIHYLTPYGLEQFSGAAWGTRDVSQGPVDLLLCQEKFGEAKQVLRTLFSRQNADGGWPQWWMFDSYRDVRADEAHGDIIYWTILALCSYVRSSGDLAFLEERLPYFAGAEAPVREHIERIITLVVQSFVPGTALVKFGGGDWNDSLQPVSEELAQRLISSWTVQMCYQAFHEYREVCERAGDTAKARELQVLCERIQADFARHLVKDGVVAGYGLVRDDQSIDVLLHPTDETTGVHYSLLPMNRGVISGLLDKQQAEYHQALIERHLQGPDGARLMDRPLRYHGGPQKIFQRAESSTYFGREIGLMYVHEHLRYAESLARTGRAEAFLHALRQAIPVDYQQVVPQGAARQANCYYSSSDVSFQSRYEADARYPEVIAGKLPLLGGWRVYSSGPGIYIALVITRLLGLRVEFGQLVLDPVLAPSLDGLEASLRFHGRELTVRYRVEGTGFGPRALTVNGRTTPFEREANPYRVGGAVLPLERFLAALDRPANVVELSV